VEVAVNGRHLEKPGSVSNSAYAADVTSRCAIVDVNQDPAHTMALVSLMEEDYEKNTSYAEGPVDYRAAGLLVSGCKRGEEQLERPVRVSRYQRLLQLGTARAFLFKARGAFVPRMLHPDVISDAGVFVMLLALRHENGVGNQATARAKYACRYAVLLCRHPRSIQKPKF
jgi:hypothetical protein